MEKISIENTCKAINVSCIYSYKRTVETKRQEKYLKIKLGPKAACSILATRYQHKTIGWH